MRDDSPNDFPPITVDPQNPHDSIRQLYLYKEPELLACIRRGDRKQAIFIINLILVHIYSAGQERSEYLKGLLLELIVMMSRAAVDAGASQTEVLGLRFKHLTELASLDDDEQLAAWLRKVVLKIFAAVEKRRPSERSTSVVKALAHIRAHSGSALTRETVAAHTGISPARLARLLKESTGQTFSELLREARVEQASDLLARTDLTMAAIAAECGFCDQSYFTHVFQDLKKMTPGAYREKLKQPGE
jgi:AraC-like DNA-binding protein